ncbi:RNA 2',3'-cyclic phosphodiesterase [Streptomyces sp. NPDC050610]|uniref:RNA 2',3'-cyclic phosphodiesterase n=1 Tax=Streptomyces sp. NPDC050610 TaxID=3157097 RepID=UPI003434080C
MRLFVAVIPPDEIVAELAGEVRRLKALPGAGRLHWTEAAGWHFTLAFLGETDETVLPELRERLGRAAARHRPPELRLSRGGRFGDRALWAGAAGETAALGRLAESVAAGCRRAAALPADARAFRAHLTLARNRADADLRPYVSELAGFEGAPWTARELTLVRSHLPASGITGERPRYEPLAVWRLGR